MFCCTKGRYILESLVTANFSKFIKYIIFVLPVKCAYLAIHI